jgi:hypothetical protein
VDFQLINAAARANALTICRHFLPGGRYVGKEYLALNPKRPDRHLGSFKVNLKTGRWKDFSSGEGGGDLVALVAWLLDVRQAEAARHLAQMLNLTGEAQ